MKFILYGNFSVDYCSEVHHAKSLEALGHEVIRLQETTITTEQVLDESLKADGLIWIHSHGFINKGMPMDLVLDKLREAGIPSIAYHLDLYMGIERWKEYETSPYMHVDWFFTVDRLMADYFNERTTVQGRYLQAGVFHKECAMLESEPVDYDVIFVGSKGYHPEWQWRPQLINWLQETYGSRFLHVGGDGATGTVRGMALNQIYANAKVAVGDTLCLNYNYPYYFSDRLFECPGRGGFNLFPYIKGIDDCFINEKEAVYYKYGDFDNLKKTIDYYLVHHIERETIRKAGHERTKKDHTYISRWQSIIKEVYGAGVQK